MSRGKFLLKSTALSQLSACFEKFYIEKKRNILATIFEYSSHSLLFIILAISYTQSKIDYIYGAKYNYYDTKFPADSFELDKKNNKSSSYNVLSLLKYEWDLINGPIIIPTFDEFIFAQSSLLSSIDSHDVNLASKTSIGEEFSNIFHIGSLHFAPNTTTTRNLIDYLQINTQMFSSIKHVIHFSEKEAIKYISAKNESFLALIVIREISAKKVNYVIRQNYKTLPNTNIAIHKSWWGMNSENREYIASGFLPIKSIIDQWVFHFTNSSSNINKDCRNIIGDVAFIPFPISNYSDNKFYPKIGVFLGLTMVLSVIYPINRLVKSIVEEKELRMKELMRIMGLRYWIYHCTWYFNAFTLFLWISITCTAITKQTFYVKSNAWLLFSFFFVFFSSLISLIFLICVFFSNANLASTVVPLLILLFTIPRYLFLGVTENEMIIAKIVSCFLSPTAFVFGADIIKNYERAGTGIQFSNIRISNELDFFTCLAIMGLDFTVYGLLALYLDQVISHDFSSNNSLLLFFNRFYWSYLSNNNSIHDVTTNDEYTCSNSGMEDINVELINSITVRIRNVMKSYKNTKILALDNFSLDLLEGQVTYLLGQNGAGKSTLIAILTGMLKASSGSISIYGYDLSNDLDFIRQIIGFCPQESILFPFMTVQEHLEFFGKLKGLSGRELKIDTDQLVEDIDLVDKRNCLSSALSGGMKRKLSLGIALCGDSKFILLDEPTSGVDPHGRSLICDLLEKKKKGRTILLTTHYIAEADYFSSRIGIMTKGKISYCGTSLFLKSLNSDRDGYLLVISISSKLQPIKEIEDKIKSIIEASKTRSNFFGELIIFLPLDTVCFFTSIFQMLDKYITDLKINSYTLGKASLENAYLDLTNKSRFEEEDNDKLVLPVYCNNLLSSFFSMTSNKSKTIRYNRIDKIVFDDSVESSSKDDIVNPEKFGLQMSSLKHIKEKEINILQDRIELSEKEDTLSNNDSIRNPIFRNDEEFKTIGDVEYNVSINYKISSEHLHNKKSVEENYSTKYETSVTIQLLELIRKRFITSTRDYRGLFFQLIFPLMEVFIFLFIFTIDSSTSERTITLDAQFYQKWANIRPTVYFSESAIYKGVINQLQLNPSIQNISIDISNSSTLSDIMLKNRQTNLFAAYLSDDNIHMRVIINWMRLRSIVGVLQFPNRTYTSSDFKKYFGIDLNSHRGKQSLDLRIQKNFILKYLRTLKIPSRFNKILNTITSRHFNRSIYLQSVSPKDLDISELFNSKMLEKLSPNRHNKISSNIKLGKNMNISTRNITFDTLTEQLCLYHSTLQTKYGPIFIEKKCYILKILPTDNETYELNYKSNYTIMYNTTSPHSIANFDGQFVQSLFQICSPYGNEALYYAKNHPLRIASQQEESLETKAMLSVSVSVLILITFCFIPATFVSFIVNERICKSKYLQLSSLSSPYLYWFATYFWDIFMFTVINMLLIIMMTIFNIYKQVVFVNSMQSSFCFFTLLSLYGASILPLSYLYSTLFSNANSAQISIISIHMFTGFVFILCSYIMSTISSAQYLKYYLEIIFRLFPPFNFGEGLIQLVLNYYRTEDGVINYFDLSVCGTNIICMMGETVIFFLILLSTESINVKKTTQSQESVNDDQKSGAQSDSQNINLISKFGVNKEILEIGQLSKDNKDYSFMVRNLIKIFTSSNLYGENHKVAIKNISFGCRKRERLGLVGKNGAGKSTLLSVLNGDILSTSGEVFINGFLPGSYNARKLIGYCPQEDPLLEFMTAFETLWFFARIRGIQKESLHDYITSIIEDIGLSKFAHFGGNKRKLSIGISLIGDPDILILDEPSNGIDSFAKRQIWNIIEKISINKSLLLVSHSIQEVEALCTKICFLQTGEIDCIGTPHYLKKCFGNVHIIEVDTDVTKLHDCLYLLVKIIPTAEVDEIKEGCIRLKVTECEDISSVIREIDKYKNDFGIRNYTVSHCSLEQLFDLYSKKERK